MQLLHVIVIAWQEDLNESTIPFWPSIVAHASGMNNIYTAKDMHMQSGVLDTARWILIDSFGFCHRSRGRTVVAATKVAGPPQLQSAPSAWTAALRNSRLAGRADLTSLHCLMATAIKGFSMMVFGACFLRCKSQS